MPIYDYKCEDCNCQEEIVSTKVLTENDEMECPKCQSKNFKRVWNLGFNREEGRDAFSFGQRSWRKGLNATQQANVLMGDSPK